MKKPLLSALLLFLLLGTLNAQDFIAPPSREGELVYIPFPVTINVDGDISDWDNIEKVNVTKGPFVVGTPDDNGQFDFSVAADMENLYILMMMPDKRIIGGRHGADYWNEDSFEFYVNFSGNLDAREYGPGIVQVNVNATNLKNDDPYNLSLSGVNFQEEGYYVRGEVFEIEGGWAIELAMKLNNNIQPYHGFTVGMQFNANGATTTDRDCKLIWSKYDGTDASWKTPHLFGSGVFFQVGSTDVPEPLRQNIPKVVERKITPLQDRPVLRVNQVGYYPDSPKLGVLVSDIQTEMNWEILNSEGEVVASGVTVPKGEDATSRDFIHHIDFSELTKEGSNYTLKVGNFISHPFDIRSDLYARLKYDAMSYFYLNRCGIPIDANYIDPKYSHGPFYASDEKVRPYSGIDPTGAEWPKLDYTLNASKGWFDAGDYGKYVVNAGISVWTLLNIYERNPSVFADNTMKIPEAGNDIPDILDEVKFEIDFLLGMQVPDGQKLAGMAHHKLHEESWSTFPLLAPERTDETNERFLFKPSTAATLNLAASAAQFSRLYRDFDSEYAETCLAAAEKAWQAALDHPEILAVQYGWDGGGDYNDGFVEDEFFWAAVELYITTGKGEYLKHIEKYMASKDYPTSMKGTNGPMYWGGVASLGSLSLLAAKSDLPKELKKQIEDMVIESADRFVKQMYTEGYPVAIFDFVWGSNSQALNKMIVMAYAYDQTGDKKYLNGITENMDYILGRNALNKSFVSGYGEYTLMYPHHRYWPNDEIDELPGPPPGVLAGGPYQDTSDSATAYFAKKVGRAKRYADDARSYSTNEVTINWNSPLTWIASYLDEQLNGDTDVKKIGKGGFFKTNWLYILIASALLILIYSVIYTIVNRRKKKRS